MDATPTATLSARPCINQIDDYAPGFKDLMLHAEVRTPRELENEVGLTEGNIFQGELTFDQLLFNRPVPGAAQYRSPIKGLWMCGSSTHPGGGVMGAPGRNAAAEILRDLQNAVQDERSLCRPMMPSSSAAAPTASPPQAASPRRAQGSGARSAAELSRRRAQRSEFAPGLSRSAPSPISSILLDRPCRARARSQGAWPRLCGHQHRNDGAVANRRSPQARRRLWRDASGKIDQMPNSASWRELRAEADALCRRAAALQGHDPAAPRQR